MNPLFKRPASFWISAKKKLLVILHKRLKDYFFLIFLNMFCVGATVKLVRQEPIPFNSAPPPPNPASSRTLPPLKKIFHK